MNREQLLRQIHHRLRDAFRDRLHGLVLYGSEARKEAAGDSDIDLLVLLDEPVDLWRDLRTAIHALYELQLEIDRPIHAIPVAATAFQTGKYALYREAKKEGVAL